MKPWILNYFVAFKGSNDAIYGYITQLPGLGENKFENRLEIR